MMNIIYWFRDHKKASLSLLGVVLFIFLMIGANNHQKQKKLEQQKKIEQEQKLSCVSLLVLRLRGLFGT